MTKAEQAEKLNEILERFSERVTRVVVGAAARGKIPLVPGSPPTIDWPAAACYLETSNEFRRIDAELGESMKKLSEEIADDEVMH